MKYIKKEPMIEAVKYTGTDENKIELWHLCESVDPYVDQHGNLLIHTVSGYKKAEIGDYVVRDTDGSFYTCNAHIFENTYSPVVKV